MRAHFLIFTTLACPALLGACSPSTSPLAPVTEAVGFTTRVGDPKPFVTEARPTDPAYLPVGVTIKRDATKKTAAEFKAIEQSLDAAKGSNESAGTQARVLGSTPPPLPPPTPPPL